MRGINSTDPAGARQLMASFGIPVVTQAVWDTEKKPAELKASKPVRAPQTKNVKNVQTAKSSWESLLPPKVLAVLGQFPTKRAALLVLWGAVLVAILPIVLMSISGKKAVRRMAVAHAEKTVEAEYRAAAEAEAVTASPRTTARQSEAAAATAVPKKDDAALDLLHSLRSEDFGSLEELTTGRFLDEFLDKIKFVRGIDLDEIQLVARGPGWVRLEARYRPSKNWFEKEETEETLILEIVEEESNWKLEDLRVTTRSNS